MHAASPTNGAVAGCAHTLPAAAGAAVPTVMSSCRRRCCAGPPAELTTRCTFCTRANVALRRRALACTQRAASTRRVPACTLLLKSLTSRLRLVVALPRAQRMVPNHTAQALQHPDCLVGRFTDDGQRLLCFRRAPHVQGV